MVKLLEFLDRHTARHLFRSSHLNVRSYNLRILRRLFSVKSLFWCYLSGGVGMSSNHKIYVFVK